MQQVSPQTAYDNLRLLESVDSASSAFYRHLAQDVLADPRVSLRWRQAIADRLIQANHWLGIQAVSGEENSY